MFNGYYWPTLRKDAIAYAQKCDKFQQFASIPHLPVIFQTPIVTAWPFDIWGLNLIELFPEGRGGCKYVIIAVDYFTKWIEAKPLKRIFQQSAINFMYEHL